MCYVIYILRLPLYIIDRNIRKRNAALIKNKMSTKCYVCGLGPSLVNEDLSLIDGDLIVLNRYYIYANQFKVKKEPLFYCVTDSYFFEDPNGFIELKKMLNYFPSTSFILNGRFRKKIEKEIGKLTNVYYIHMWGRNIKKNSVIDFTKTVPIGMNVVCTAITLAIYLKYDTINLLGCDFNSFAKVKSEHCYKKDDNQRQISLSMELFCYSFVADQHYSLDKCAKENGIKIYNKTKGSLIDAYERQ